MSIVLDMIATLLSGGQATHEITPVVADETGQSQVFVALDPSTLGATKEVLSSVERIVDDLHETGSDVRYPGERTLATRQRSMSEGVEVEPSIWEAVRALLGRS